MRADPDSDQLPSLDGLRALAVIGVLFFHVIVMGQLELDQIWLELAELGRNGVDLFFVLSGFLITGILLSTRDAHGYFRSFCARRALRIFPAYYLYLSVVAAVCAAVPELWAVFARSWPWYVTYTTNIQLAFVEEHTVELTRHLWSLAVEEQFYLIWPLVIAWMPRRWLLSFTCVAIALIVAGRHWWAHHEPGSYAIYASTWTRADALLLGAAVALTRTNSASWRRLVKLAPLVLLLCVVCFWLPAVRALIDEVEAHFTLTAVLFAALLTLCVARDERAGSSSWLRHPVLQHIGRLSYGIYLYQFGLALYGPAFFERWFPLGRTNALVAIVVIAAVSYALAALSYRYIEAPMLRLKKHFPRPVPGLSTPTTHKVANVAADFFESGGIRSQTQRE